MPKHHQYSLDLIERRLDNSIVQQRSADGYINASELCTAAGKKWHQYLMAETTGHFLRELARKTGIADRQLHQEVFSPAGTPSVWVHPKVAVHLATWLSAEFAVQVSEWVYDWMSGKGAPGRKSAELPPHLKRHMLNLGKIPATHFSILQEMTLTLIAPLEAQGYSLPESMVPDISQGKLFCKFLRDELGLDTSALPTYDHEYPDGRVFPAKLYPVKYLGEFRTFVNDVWMPQRAQEYFKTRDPQALPLLDKILRIGSQPPRLPTSPKPRRAA